MVLAIAVTLAIALVGTLVALDEPIPHGESGPAADALARRLERAVHADAWAATGAVRFTFPGGHRWLWDRTREVAMLEDGERTVLVRLDRREGRVIAGERSQEAIDRTYDAFFNDSYWLMPLTKLFDAGAQRRLVRDDALLVTFTSGGSTPGDSYLWELGEHDLPAQFRMWVSVIPLGGLTATWERWVALDTGALVSTLHRFGPIRFELSDVAGAASLAALQSSRARLPGELRDDDPFRVLFE